jgi:hypothetical protein
MLHVGVNPYLWTFKASGHLQDSLHFNGHEYMISGTGFIGACTKVTGKRLDFEELGFTGLGNFIKSISWVGKIRVEDPVPCVVATTPRSVP